MAMLDLSKAAFSVDMTDPNLVKFEKVSTAYPTDLYYNTPNENSVHLSGDGMTYDANGKPVTGTVTRIDFDIGAFDPFRTELTITGISLDAATVTNGGDDFWRFLEGNDVIIGGSSLNALPGAEFRLFGDGTRARFGVNAGGNDIIQPGDMRAFAYGDVAQVGIDFDTFLYDYRGGMDDIVGGATTDFQFFSGDVDTVYASGRLTGGNDTIYIQSTDADSAAVGDAAYVGGIPGRTAEVIGGDDYIGAGPDFHGTLTGDVGGQGEFSIVYAGDDRIEGGKVRDKIYGDVEYVFGGRLYGGADRLRGNGGDDLISGDAGRVENGAVIDGGNDTIYGGDGSDRLFGEWFVNDGGAIAGGDDFIWGEAGSDNISGQTGNDYLFGGTEADRLDGGIGNDFLDGGQGADTMEGGEGNDYYVFDTIGDTVVESAGQGTDTVLSYFNSYQLRDHFENLTSLATGDFLGIGNILDNVIQSGAGNDSLNGRRGNDLIMAGDGKDQLHGEEGDDTLDGGAGADRIEGGDGFDTISYASAGQGVRFALDGAFVGTGDAEGDSILGIEGLLGSSYSDVLRGDAVNNRIDGAAGNDVLLGRGGNDAITGGTGRDKLSGGSGNDSFIYSALNEGGDTIIDFANVSGNNDLLRFEGDAFGDLPTGALAAKHFVANTSGAATTADQHFIYETDTGVLRYDANGSASGGVVVIATLTGAPTITAADFFII